MLLFIVFRLFATIPYRLLLLFAILPGVYVVRDDALTPRNHTRLHGAE